METQQFGILASGHIRTFLTLAAGMVLLFPSWVQAQASKTKVDRQCEEALRKSSPSVLALCDDIVKTRARLMQRVRKNNEAKVYDRVAAKERKDLQELVATIRRVRLAPSLVCKVTATNSIKCVRYGQMLAYYDSQTAQKIVSDINLLSSSQQFTTLAKTIFKCWDGTWGQTEAATTSQSASNASQPSAEEQRAMSAACMKSWLQNANRGPSVASRIAGRAPTTEGRFSGITGIDPFRSSCFAPDMTRSTDWATGMLGAAIAIHTACDNYAQPGASVQTNAKAMADGDAASNQTVTATKNASGDTVVTTTSTDSSGTTTTVSTNATNGDTTVTTSGSGGTTTTDVTSSGGGTTVVTTDSGGNTNATFTDSGGTSYSYNVDSGGKVTDSTISRSDGTWERSSYRADGTRASTSRSDGTWMKWGADGKTPQVYHDGNGSYIFYDSNGKPQVSGTINQFATCAEIDAGCGQCSAAADLLRETVTDCFKSGGGGSACGGYQSMAACCGSSTVGDPRIVMPKPDGDLSCNVDGGTAAKNKACQQKCSVAQDRDCQKVCMDSEPRTLPVDAMDIYCTKAIDERCYSSGGITVPTKTTPKGPVGPKPTVKLSTPFENVRFRPVGACDPNTQVAPCLQ